MSNKRKIGRSAAGVRFRSCAVEGEETVWRGKVIIANDGNA